MFGTNVLDWPGFVAFGQSFVDAFSDGRHEFDLVVAEGDTVATIGDVNAMWAQLGVTPPD